MKRVQISTVVIAVLLVLAGCSGAPTGGENGTDSPATSSPAPNTSTNGTTTDGTPAGRNGPSATFIVDGEAAATLTLEVADTSAERDRGLMDRESLAAGHGMVFVFEDAGPRAFWMKNTLVPLDMIFVAPNGTVLNVEHAAPQPNASDAELKRYRSEGDAQYVIEANRGFANETGIRSGTTVRFDGLNASNGTGTGTGTRTGAKTRSGGY